MPGLNILKPILPDEEKDKYYPYEAYNKIPIYFSRIPKIEIPVEEEKNYRNVFSYDSHLLNSDRSARLDWLSSIFDLISSPPNFNCKEKWISETSLVCLIRRGGINKKMLIDQDIRCLYLETTVKYRIQGITKNIFLNEFIKKLAQILFPKDEFYKREVKLIVNYFYENLLVNLDELILDIRDINIDKDLYIENLNRRKTIDIVCSDRASENYKIPNELDSTKRSIPEKSKNVSSINLTQVHKNSEYGNSKNQIETAKISKDVNTFTSDNNKIEQNLKCETMYSKFIKFGNCFPESFNSCAIKLRYCLFKIIENKDLIKDDEVINDEKSTLDYIKKLIEKEELIEKEQKKNISKNKNLNIDPFKFIVSLVLTSYDCLELCYIAIDSDINWEFINEGSKFFRIIMTFEYILDFTTSLWISFFIAILYIFFSKIKKKFQLKSFVINIAGGILFSFVLKNQLSVFSCNNKIDPPVLYNTDIVCYETFHIIIFVFSILIIIPYYLIATFRIPMEYNTTSMELNIKFTKYYMILLNQLKLLIMGLSVFLPSQYYLIAQLATSTACILAFFIYFSITDSCNDYSIYWWVVSCLFIAFITNFFGLMNVIISGRSLLITILTLSIISLAFLFGIIMVLINKFKKDNKVTSEQKP